MNCFSNLDPLVRMFRNDFNIKNMNTKKNQLYWITNIKILFKKQICDNSNVCFLMHKIQDAAAVVY